MAPEAVKGKVVLQNFSADGGASLNSASIGTDGMESLSKSDMSITSQDAMTTAIYKKDSAMAHDMPMMEESKGQEDVEIDVREDDRIYIGGNKKLQEDDENQIEIKLSDLKVVGTLG